MVAEDLPGPLSGRRAAICGTPTGNEVLDFVGGFGSLNLGHNHPAVSTAVARALSDQTPGFCQTSLNPFAALLAEKLVDLAPNGLEMAFFCNSGTESVEAALKLARAATGRTGFVCCEGSFHGKTMGALSVTAKLDYQKPFGPLVPGCEVVPYGDLQSLEQRLRTRQFAALVIEPIQGEAGMVVPPDGYLAEAQAICRSTETLLVVDEVQTGLGRTGSMFAVDDDGVEPDVLTLAKSLGGGLMPIGAMLTRPELWKRAYGSATSFALHTTTFGGGSLACVAALATLTALQDQSLVENVRARSEQLRTGLEQLGTKYPRVVREVRGRGLMLGIELRPFDPIIVSHWNHADKTGTMQYLMPQWLQAIETMPAIYMMNTLLEQHSVYTQVSRSNPLVLRVQPPLILSEAEASRFLQAMDVTMKEMETCGTFVKAMITKSHLGIHEALEENKAANGPQTMPPPVPGFPAKQINLATER